MGQNYALVVAAGKGTRMGANINKQFINIKGKPVIYYSLKTFNDSEYIDKIVIVSAENEIDYVKNEIVRKYCFEKVEAVVAGGSQRYESVYNGLKAISNDCETVLIHDGARPFVSNRIIGEGLKYAQLYGACTCGVKPKDTIKVINAEGFSVLTPKRSELFAVQTPQCFSYSIIKECHERIQKADIEVTDDTMVVETFGYKVYTYEGSYDNIKITTPDDISVAEAILEGK